MHLIIFGVVFVVFLVLYIRILSKYMHRVLLLLKGTRNRKRTRYNIFKNTIRFICAFVALVISLILLAIIAREFVLALDLKVECNTNEDVSESQYTDAIDKIPFHDEMINEEQTIWEHLFVEEMLYDKYEQLGGDEFDFKNLREKYVNEFCDADELPNIAIDELKEHVKFFYGSEILPVTNKTLERVVTEIPPLEDRINTDVLVFENEFYLRVDKCDLSSPDECFYQVARAADDAFKVLFHEKNLSIKKKLFYGSMAVAFYLASINNYEGNIDLLLTYYRIAEIYIYLYKYVGFIQENIDYSKHCLLMSEMFLILAKKEYSKKMDFDDIHKKLTYFNYYYADILFDYITKYCKDEEVEEIGFMCYKLASDYLNSPYTVSYNKNRDGCRNILTNLEMKGYEKK